MTDRSRRNARLRARSLALLVALGFGITALSGCTSCSLNGGWERTVNPFCHD